jgi:hypothetical protein
MVDICEDIYSQKTSAIVQLHYLSGTNSTNRILDVLEEDNFNILMANDIAQILAVIVGNM